jgi:hypothetical protein
MYWLGSLIGAKPQSAYTWCASAVALAAVLVRAKGQRVRDRAIHHVAGNSFGPVGTGDEPVHHVEVESLLVIVNLVFILGHQRGIERTSDPPERFANYLLMRYYIRIHCFSFQATLNR